MKVDIILKTIIFLITLKIASPFGVFFLTFFLPITLSVIAIFIFKYKLHTVGFVFSGVIPSSLVLLSWLLIFYNTKFPIELYAHYFYITSIVSIITFSFVINSFSSILYKSAFWQDLTKNLIVFHGVILLTQIVLYHLLGITLDLGELTGGNEIRSIYFFNGQEIFRASGLYEEPSIFSAYMFSYIVVRYIFNANSVDRYIVFGTSCMLMTWSTLAVILVIIFYIISSIRFNIYSFIIALATVAIIGGFSLDFIISRYENTISGLDPSNLTKIKVITDFINDRDLIIYGYGLIRKNMFYGLDGLGDTTVYTSLITIFGIFIGGIITILILLGIVFSELKIREKILISSVFIKFAWPGYMIFWFFVVYSISFGRRSKK